MLEFTSMHSAFFPHILIQQVYLHHASVITCKTFGVTKVQITVMRLYFYLAVCRLTTTTSLIL